MLKAHLNNGQIDLAWLDLANSIGSVADREHCWRQCCEAGKECNFRQTFCCNCCTWEAEQHRQNARREVGVPLPDDARDPNRGVWFADEAKEDDSGSEHGLAGDPDSEFDCFFQPFCFMIAHCFAVVSGDKLSGGEEAAVHAHGNRQSVDCASEQHHEDNLPDLLQGLQIAAKAQKCGSMLICHWCTWEEGVTQAQVAQGINVGLHCLTVDVLLPGPTVMDQVECSVTGACKIKIMCKPPSTCLNSHRTTAKSAALPGVGLGT